MRYRGAALLVAGIAAAAALGAALAAAQGPSTSPKKAAARFNVDVLQPLLPTDGKTDRIALDITNTGGASGWPRCKVVATATGLHWGAISYWSTSQVEPGETVHTDVRLTIVDGGVRFLSYRDVTARCHAASGPGPLPPARPRVVVPAVPPTALPPKDVGNLEMFTSTDGVAVAGAEEPDGLPGPAYLVSTADGGTRWSVSGTLPLSLTRRGLVTAGLAFESEQAGYLVLYDRTQHSDILFFTADRGTTWKRVTTPDSPSSISLEDGSLWSVAEHCTTPTLRPSNCQSQILAYRFGALQPTSIADIPTLTQKFDGEPKLFRRLSATAGIFSTTGITPLGLAITNDAGRSWQYLDDPCAGTTGIPPRGLVVTAPGHWLLLCEISGGMMNYEVRLYGTNDAGSSWQLVAERNDTPSLPQVGSIGAGFSFAASGDGQVVWLLGVLGGVHWSLDGGARWTGAYPITTGGAIVDLATAGASDAWVADTWNGLYSTTNGTTWRKLPAG